MRPYMIAVNSLGHPVFSEYSAHRVTRIQGLDLYSSNPLASGSATLHKVAGIFGSPGNSDDTGAAISARLRNPADVEYDANNNLLIADMHNYKVRRIDNATATIDTIAGTGNQWWDAGGNACGPATQRNLHRPHGLWIENNGDFYITQTSSQGNAGYRFIRHVTY